MTDFKTLDVRPILRSGGEPFQAIMSAVEDLKPGQGLKLLAPFRPQPLFSVMDRRGFGYELEELSGGEFEVRFVPKQDVTPVDVSPDAASPDLWPDPSVDLDLTDLDPPEPMVELLAQAERMEPGEVIFAVLSREPVFLYPELTERGHQWVGNFDATGTTYRIMIRVGPKAPSP
ncbi:MAG TPA: DUF2249 domain-containing protein [Pseudorhizobium sp.]|jgi:uncharacterized protein (DUF2249 family)/TusA-related sulfurtransferase|nr:DUF2249 domain-containing protein [Pseudorhizobium sp.]